MPAGPALRPRRRADAQRTPDPPLRIALAPTHHPCVTHATPRFGPPPPSLPRPPLPGIQARWVAPAPGTGARSQLRPAAQPSARALRPPTAARCGACAFWSDDRIPRTAGGASASVRSGRARARCARGGAWAAGARSASGERPAPRSAAAPSAAAGLGREIHGWRGPAAAAAAAPPLPLASCLSAAGRCPSPNHSKPAAAFREPTIQNSEFETL